MKTVAVIFGGRSAEHDVSIISALTSVIKPLELTGQYRVEAIYIAKDGSWYWDDRLKDIALYQSGIEDFCQKAPKVHLLFEDGLTLVKSSQFAGRKMYRHIDVAFPVMHGTYGEDGSLHGAARDGWGPVRRLRGFGRGCCHGQGPMQTGYRGTEYSHRAMGVVLGFGVGTQFQAYIG